MRKILLSLFVITCVVNTAISQMISTSPTGLMNYQRAQHQSQLLPNGKVLIFGGTDYYLLNLTTHKSSELYNPIANTWELAGFMKYARVHFASAVLNSGEVLAIGGFDENQNLLATCELYNAQTNQWTDVAPMNRPRYKHNAIKLLNGLILVAGPDNTAELYDATTNTWTFTENMAKSRGNGMTLTLLNNGKVLAVGGDNSKNTAEIFDPLTRKWRLITSTTNIERYQHSSVLLANGKVLIVGSATANFGMTCELFDPVTETFTYTGSMDEVRSYDPAIVMDDNRVLVFDIGDLSKPTDTKIFEIYNPITSTWSHDTYTSIGASLYSINKLDNGKVLIAGGTFTTGNGASNNAFIVNNNALSSGITKSYAITVDNSSPCYGKNVTLTMPSSQSGVSYTAYNNTNPISNTVTGGGAVILTIPYDKLTSGKNIIKVMGKKTGCYSEAMTQQITINTAVTNLSIPVLSVKDTAICDASTININASASGSIIWSDMRTGNSIMANKGLYFAQSIDGNGCLSLPSKTAAISYMPSSAGISAGANVTVCTFNNAFDLGGTPVGGYWTGAGIENLNKFNPALVDTGSYFVQYNYCGASAIKQIKVKESPNVPDFSMALKYDSTCPSSITNYLYITNANPSVKYQLYKNNVLLQTYTNNTSFTYTIASGSIIKTSEFLVKAFYSECSIDTLIKKDTIHFIPLAISNLKIGLVRDTVCSGDSPVVYIVNPQKSISYYVFYSSSILSDTITCNEDTDTLFIPIRPNYNFSTVYVGTINVLGCKSTLAGSIYPKTKSVNVDFSISFDTQNVNDSILATNISTANTYQWTYSPAISVLNISNDKLSFSSASSGVYDVTLTGTSRYGCVRSKTKTVTFMDEYLKDAQINICHSNILTDLNKNKIYPENIIAQHIDKDGYVYISYYKKYQSIYLEINMYVSKIAPDGTVMWTIEQSQNYSIGGSVYAYSVYCNGITTDPAGNVYLTGSYFAKALKFNNIIVGKIETNNTTYTHFYAMKLDSKGNVLWSNTSEESGGTNAGTDIEYVDEDNIFISIIGNGDIRFTNGLYKISYGSGYQLVRINSKGEFVEKYITEVTAFNNLRNAFNPPNAGAYYSNHTTVVGPKLEFNKNELHILGRAYPNFGLNTTKIISDSTIVYFDYTFDLATKKIKNPKKVFETSAYQTLLPLDFKYDTENENYYILVNNKVYCLDSLSNKKWSYEFNATLQAQDLVSKNKNVFVQGWFKNYYKVDNLPTIEGVNKGNFEDAFIARIDSTGNLIGIDNFGSIGVDMPYAIMTTPKNELITIGTAEKDIYYNNNLIQKATNNGYYLRTKLDGLCLSSDYDQLKITNPLNQSIVCNDSVVKLNWYILQSDSLILYYRLANSEEYIQIQKNIDPNTRQFLWKVPNSLLGKQLCVKITNGSTLSDSVLFNVLPLAPKLTLIDTILCKGSVISYDFGNQYNSYSWSTGESVSSKVFVSPSTTTCTVTNAIGCTGERIFNVKELKPKITVKVIDNSGFLSTCAIQLIKIVNNSPVVVSTSYSKNTYVLDVDTGTYYIRSIEGAVPTYYSTSYQGAIILSNATAILVDECLDSIPVTLKLITKKQANSNPSYYAYYRNGSCSGSAKAGISVFLVDNDGLVLQHTLTNSIGAFSLAYFDYSGNNNLVFDDYPAPYVKFPIVYNVSNQVFYKSNNQIYKCITVDIEEVEIENGSFKYSNPVSDNLIIWFSTRSNKVTISLLDIKGSFIKEIYNGDLEQNKEYTISTSINDLPEGVYICSFDDGVNTFAKKIIVTR